MSKINRGSALAVIIAVLAVVLIVMSTMLYVMNHRNAERASKYDQQPAALIQRLDFSERSKLQIREFVDMNDEVVGVMALRRHFKKDEMPVFFVYSADHYLDLFIDEWWKIQNGPNGSSSADLEKKVNSALHNDNEAVLGQIKCLPTDNTPMAGLVPGFHAWAPVSCTVTFPPYKAGRDTNIAMLVLLSTSPDNEAELQNMKNKIFAMQMDIDNRDYKGRETWVPKR